MNVKGVSHIAIGVRDTERSLHFYRDLLGLRVVMDTLHVQQDHRGLLKDKQRAERRAVYLRWDEGPEVAWLLLSQPTGEASGEAIRMDHVGIHHVSFWVNDIRGTYEKLLSEKVAVVLPLAESEPGGAMEQLTGVANCLTTIVKDPDGILIQLDELANSVRPSSAREISHIAIGVRDMERSLHHYRDLLGLPVVIDTLHVQQDHGGLLKNSQRAERRAVYLRWDEDPEAIWLVLSQPIGEASGEAIRMDQVGIHHISYWVEDVQVLYEKMSSAGTPILRPPTESEPGGAMEQLTGSKGLTLQVEDPDGIIVQFDQRANRGDPGKATN